MVQSPGLYIMIVIIVLLMIVIADLMGLYKDEYKYRGLALLISFTMLGIATITMFIII